MVIVCQAAWLRPLATKTTGSALSSGPGSDGGLVRRRVRAAAMASAGGGQLRAPVRFGTRWPSVTGEPLTVSSRPLRVTAAWSPASKTFWPPTSWVQDRWWVPAMST